MFLYKIQNSVDNKQYVGIANNIQRRWREHRSDLRGDRHGNSHLQFAWDLYGEDKFSFSILEEFIDSDSVKKAEIEYLQNPEELEIRCKKYNNTKSRSSRFREVFGMNIKTKALVHYAATYHVKKDGFSQQSVYKCCTNQNINKSYRGFVWSFEKQDLSKRMEGVLKNKTYRII